MKKHALNKWLFLLVFTFSLCLALGIASFPVQRTSFADEYSYKVFSPNDLSENYPLSSPTDVLFFNGNVAITENPDKIVLYVNGNYLNPITVAGATSLDQLCLLNENTLLVLSFNTIYKLSLVDYSVSILTDNNGAPVTCTHYDTNGKYLVAGSSNEGSARIYTIEGDKVIRSDYTIDGINGNKPVAIDNDLLIYVKNEKIYSRSLTDLSVEPTLLTELNPERILVSREYYFFSLSGKIFKYNKSTKELNEFSVKNTYPNADVYQLGHLGDLSNISFRGDNIAVTSLANNTIQEFKVIDNTLEFTGYAITNNKTAYNRFINVSDIQKFGDKVAILDGLKLSIVNPLNDNPYSPDKFNNLFVNEKVSHFAVGEYSIVYFSENGKINYYDLNAKTPEDAITFITDAKSFCDITYRFGKYYFITTDGLNSYFYTLDENTKELIKKEYSSPDFSLVEVDVFGNVYTVDQNNLLINDVVFTTLEGAVKIQTDFAGNLYALKNGKISKLNRQTKQFEDYNALGNVNNFALSFDTKTVYYTLANSELVYSTDSLDNVAINSTILPSDFILSGTSANIDNLMIYSINEGSVVYSVSHLDGHFVYNKLITPLSQYAFICDVNYDGIVYKCLAGVNGLILVYDNYLTEQVITTEEQKQTVFVTTTVHAYYLPLITLDGAHYLSNEDNKVILNKHSEVNTLYKLNVSDRDFYYVSLSEGVFAYIPLDFTVKTLSKDVALFEFTIEQFDSPTLYNDAELSSEFEAINNNVKLKVLSIENGVAKILYSTEEGNVIVYTSASGIVDNAKIWIRNVLIILALVTSVAGTTTYFLLRRKIKD